ncbi:VPLPA-CTERM sorting domain-containing protein [Puniceibacterium sp. IMCC21224]|uniref:VPLPA-CTERM sorting domain-containing protein n=1 Tax=Puniceibacterium sp. IMCC21224 TaxID=1618204 RepID=UPI00064DE4F0|nr:VPLPA-CTERM sorting domain-containing protein [Puniceibacterium sp. IMCC21224]KMK66647.1 hypothetical protein IMCC21224_111503 [Puniceibacterium sp. IMCC21224]
MKLFKIAAVAATVALSSIAFSAHAATIGSLTGIGFTEASSLPITPGSTIQFSSSLFEGSSGGEYAGFDLVSVGNLVLSTGAVNNGQTFSAVSGSHNITFTISDTAIASVTANPGFASSWNLAGLLTVWSPTLTLLAETASFSFTGNDVNAPGFSFSIQTPPEGFASPVPLPAGAFLLFGALVGLGAFRRKA